MLLGIFVSLGNTDPISIDFMPSVILGLSIVVGAIAYFAVARLKHTRCSASEAAPCCGTSAGTFSF